MELLVILPLAGAVTYNFIPNKQAEAGMKKGVAFTSHARHSYRRIPRSVMSFLYRSSFLPFT
ncbi:MAG: hypothetical protein AAFX96_07925, partial [Pseudomonadota bacterium]